MKKIWLGALHYGNLISYDNAFLFIEKLLQNKFEINLDISYLYSGGEALIIVGELCKNFPEIKVSIKYGLQKMLNKDGRWGVDISNQSKTDVEKSIISYLKYIPKNNIDSFQLHAFNREKCKEWLEVASEFGIFKKYGCSNMSALEAMEVIDIGKSLKIEINIFQIHANFLEQRILKEYLDKEIFKEIIINRSLARGFLSNRFVNGKLSKDSRIINSPRVKKSLHKNIVDSIKEFQAISQKYEFTLSQAAYLWILNNSKRYQSFFPIISPRSMSDLYEYLDIYNKKEEIKIKLCDEINAKLLQFMEHINSYPLFYLEK